MRRSHCLSPFVHSKVEAPFRSRWNANWWLISVAIELSASLGLNHYLVYQHPQPLCHRDTSSYCVLCPGVCASSVLVIHGTMESDTLAMFFAIFYTVWRPVRNHRKLQPRALLLKKVFSWNFNCAHKLENVQPFQLLRPINVQLHDWFFKKLPTIDLKSGPLRATVGMRRFLQRTTHNPETISGLQMLHHRFWRRKFQVSSDSFRAEFVPRLNVQNWVWRLLVRFLSTSEKLIKIKI